MWLKKDAQLLVDRVGPITGGRLPQPGLANQW